MHSSGGHFWTWHINHRMGAIIAYISCRVGLRPNYVSLISLLITTLATLLLYLLPVTITDSVLLILVFQIGYSFDCADGQLARATGQGTNFGKWFDVAIDLASALTVPAALTAFAIYKLEVDYPLLYALFGFLLAYARASSLITSTIKRQAGGTILGNVSLLRKIYRLITDTGFFLTVISLIRFNEYAILFFLIIYSMLFLIHSYHLAKALDTLDKF